ncbi:MAG: hypothetical protein A2Y90_00040 [Chloroflexi bacterium RBG_13_52_12]|nr:MAG: hypothetical protein A2Y90_00040 [Chloroflexi bacterium RBG_13_52_12]
MPEFKQGDVKVNGIKIHYYRTGGKKPPFVLLHGATDNGLCWTPVAELLSDKYDVIMPDAQGHGLSDRLDPAFSFENHTNQGVALIREMGLKKPIIMGHSMGAGTAVNIAVEFPSLPKTIILEDPAWRKEDTLSPEQEREMAKQHEAFMKSLIDVSKHTPEEVLADGRQANPRWSEVELAPWARAKLQFDTTLFSTMVINPRSYEELVPQIKCPTLLIIAEKGIVSKETAENIARLWKSRKPFRWVQIMGATHNIRRDQPSAFKKALFDWLKTLAD